MSFLSDFGGAFATGIGNQMQQREDEERALKLQEVLERRRFARQHNMKASVEIPVPTPFGAPVQRGPGNWEQPTKIQRQALLNELTGEVERPGALEDGPSLPASDPFALSPKDQATIAQRDRAAQLRADTTLEAAKIRGSRGGGGSSRGEVGEDGLTAYQRAQLEERRKNRERLEGQSGGKGGMTEKGWREGLDATLNSIQGAEAGKLKTLIRQYGGDNIMTGDMDDDMLRETAFSVAETYWNQRKPSNKKASEPSKQSAAPEVPPGAKEGQVYQDDETGDSWKVVRGKMVKV